MHAEIPNLKLAIQVCWALFWRIILFGLLGLLLTSLALAIIIALTGADQESIKGGILSAIVPVILLYVFIKVVQHLMTKGFGSYRLSVVKK